MKNCVFLTLLVASLLFSCDLLQEADSTVTPYQAITEVGQQYQSLLNLMSEYGVKSINTLVEYADHASLEVFNESNARSLHPFGLISLEDIEAMKFHPHRMRKSGDTVSRSVSLPDEMDDKLLDEVLEEIALAFQSEVALLRPDLSFLEGIPDIEVEDGIVILDGYVIDTNTLDGIMTIELLKAQMADSDILEITNDINGVLSNYQDHDNLSRGLYKKSTRLWLNGKVNYVWGSISTDAKIAVSDAMRDWESKVPGIKFVDKTNGVLFKLFTNLWINSCVRIEQDLKLSAYGSATLGRSSGFSSYKIRYAATDGVFRQRAPRHEFGHTLGLLHENQRHDSHRYLTTTWNNPNDVNFEIIPSTVLNLVPNIHITFQTILIAPEQRITYTTYTTVFIGNALQMIPITQTIIIPPVYTTVAVPYINGYSLVSEVYSYAIGTFDYESIMLYSYPQAGYTALVAQQGLRAGDLIPINTKISAGDTATVRRMYL